MKIGLYYNMPDRMVGCKKLIMNLLAGLNQLNIEVLHNVTGDINGCLQKEPIKDLSKNTLIGPEIMVLPNEYPELWRQYKYWVQPSVWVHEYMKCFNIIKNNDISIWPVGIDTDEFNETNRKPIYDCFIYYKNVTRQTDLLKLKFVESELKEMNLDYKVIKYGEYNECSLKELTKTCKCAIWLVGTESQNIALMEVLSSGIPVYVIDETTFIYNGFMWQGASSAPYFDSRCGVKVKNFMKNTFTSFISRLDSYDPRTYILENHTLKKGAEKYLKILERINEVESGI